MGVAPLVDSRAAQQWTVTGEQPEKVWHRHFRAVLLDQPLSMQFPVPRAQPAVDYNLGRPRGHGAQ
jgi:hypothetical protein